MHGSSQPNCARASQLALEVTLGCNLCAAAPGYRASDAQDLRCSSGESKELLKGRRCGNTRRCARLAAGGQSDRSESNLFHALRDDQRGCDSEGYSETCQRGFRTLVRKLIRKLIRKLGTALVLGHIPRSHAGALPYAGITRGMDGVMERRHGGRAAQSHSTSVDRDRSGHTVVRRPKFDPKRIVIEEERHAE